MAEDGSHIGKKALLVEDDVFMLGLLAEKLKKGGFEVVTAQDGNECLQKLGDELPDLILLDIVMPNMDGFQILEKLRGDARLSLIPVIVLSNLGQKDEILKALDLGARDYIIKANTTTGEIVEKAAKIFQ